MSSVYPPQSLVWVKLEGYPWWPAFVGSEADLEIAGAPAPAAGYVPIAVIFCHTHDVSAVNALDSDVICPFDPRDEAKVAECTTEDLISAYNRAVELWSSGLAAEEEGEEEGDDNNDTGDEDRQRRKQEKKKRRENKERRRKDKKSKKEKHRKHRHGESDDEGSSSDGEASSDGDGDGDRDGGQRGRRRASAVKGNGRQQTAAKRARGGDRTEAAIGGRPTTIPARSTTTIEELVALRERLEGAVASGALEEGRSVLSALAGLDVPFAQLKATRIGAAVGRLLEPSSINNPTSKFNALVPLAGAILMCWFTALPGAKQQELRRVEDVEAASVASQADVVDDAARADMATLTGIGVRVERCFSTPELLEAAVDDASHVAHAIQIALDAVAGTEARDDAVNEVLSALSHDGHGGLRLRLLRGELSATEFVCDPLKHARTETERAATAKAEADYARRIDITGEAETIRDRISTAAQAEYLD